VDPGLVDKLKTPEGASSIDQKGIIPGAIISFDGKIEAA